MNAKRILAGLVAAAALLIGVEIVWGAVGHEPPAIASACGGRAPFPGHGFDAAVQRIVLDGLDGAACRLHTSREELVLSLGSGTTGKPRRWDEHTIEVAIRAGLLRSVDEAAARGDIPGLVAPLLRQLIETAPIGKLVRGGISLSDLIG